MRAKVHGCSKMQMEYEIFYFVLGPTFVMYYCKFTRDRAWGDQAKDQEHQEEKMSSNERIECCDFIPFLIFFSLSQSML